MGVAVARQKIKQASYVDLTGDVGGRFHESPDHDYIHGRVCLGLLRRYEHAQKEISIR